MKIFVWVQHLFGLGHTRRMARIAEACGAQGIEVTIAAGGPGGREVFQGLDHVAANQLPALRTRDHQYTGLLTEGGDSPDEVFWAKRAEALTYLLTESSPDILLIELFPFGRRKFASEVLNLIAAAKAMPRAPLIVSSVRDIVEPKEDPKKTAQMSGWLKDNFDVGLVHGDERIISLDATAPFANGANVPLIYTGYVAPAGVPATEKAGVVVSAGSGPSGEELLSVAAAAGDGAATAANPWHIFVPKTVTPPTASNARVHIHSFTDEFSQFLARAEVAIGEAGYNSTVEAIALDARPVLVPYEAAGQTEQPTRARAFAEAGLAVHLPASSLSPDALLNAIGEAKTLAPRAALNLSGAKTAATTLKDLRKTLGAS